MRRIFADQIGAVTGMELVIAKPVRQHDGARKLVKLHGVLEATADPFLYHDVVVVLQGIQVARPHGASRVVSPTDLSSGILHKLVSAVYKLHSLDTLLAKATIVQRPCGLVETIVREKSLHAPSIGHAHLDSRTISEELLFRSE